MTDVFEPELILKQPRISSLQLAVLRRLKEHGAVSAYYLGASIGTLNSLALKKLVAADRSKIGSVAMPRTSILWRITEEGCQLIQSKE